MSEYITVSTHYVQLNGKIIAKALVDSLVRQGVISQVELWKIEAQEIHERITALLAAHPTMSLRELARHVGCSHETARKYKQRILQELVP